MPTATNFIVQNRQNSDLEPAALVLTVQGDQDAPGEMAAILIDSDESAASEHRFARYAIISALRVICFKLAHFH